MTLSVRLTTIVAVAAVIALSLAGTPRSSHAGAAVTPTAKNCFFVRNNLPCPCPRAPQRRAVARAVHVTAGAIGTAIATTASALTRAEGKPDVPAAPRKASPSTQPPKP